MEAIAQVIFDSSILRILLTPREWPCRDFRQQQQSRPAQNVSSSTTSRLASVAWFHLRPSFIVAVQQVEIVTYRRFEADVSGPTTRSRRLGANVSRPTFRGRRFEADVSRPTFRGRRFEANVSKSTFRGRRRGGTRDIRKSAAASPFHPWRKESTCLHPWRNESRSHCLMYLLPPRTPCFLSGCQRWGGSFNLRRRWQWGGDSFD